MASRKHRRSTHPANPRKWTKHPPLGFVQLEDRVVPSGIGHDHDLAARVDLAPPFELVAPSGFLTGPKAGEPRALALSALAANAGRLGLLPGDVANPVVERLYTDFGRSHVYFRQRFNGLDVINTHAGVHFTSAGELITINGSFVPGLSALDGGSAAIPTPAVSPTQAVYEIAEEFGHAIKTAPVVVSVSSGPTRETVIDEPELSNLPIVLKLAYVYTDGGVRPVWDTSVQIPNEPHWYHVAVDTQTGAVPYFVDWVAPAVGAYNAIAFPIESPLFGDRTVEVGPFNPTFSPFGWHDTNGVAGPEFTSTRGNNVNAQADPDSNPFAPGPISSIRPDAGPGLVFDYPFDDTSTGPDGYVDALVTNLFYTNNMLHDIHAAYGFTEAAGNFQKTNYSGKGQGGDPVRADAIAGSNIGFTNNAFMGTPPDGQAPRMTMFRFTLTNPNRTSDFDNGIIIHEFGHGVSNRLTGNANGLNVLQSFGMGEGWSDWWSLMLTQTAKINKNTAIGVGNYVLGLPPDGPGIRRQPYSFDLSIDKITFADFNGGFPNNESHNAGEIWASTLWDMNWLLIEKYGFDPDLSTGYDETATGGPAKAGNKLALRLVMDALKLQPSNPSFINARDAILLADRALTGGVNQREIWTAFARRGLGFGASTANGDSATITTSFTLPPEYAAAPGVIAQSPTGVTVGPAAPSQVRLTFSEAMNPASFNKTVDILSFTGPNGVDLRPAITSTAWIDGDKTVVINFMPLPIATGQGRYELVLAPTIQAADNGAELDQDFDGVPGEPTDDRYTARFAHDSSVLQVVNVTPANGGMADTGLTFVEYTFSEDVDAASLNAAGLQLSQGSVAKVEQGAAKNIVRFHLGELAAGSSEPPIFLTLKYGAVTDAFGFPNLQFNSSFTLDIDTVPYPVPLNRVGPLGWGVYQGKLNPLPSIGTGIDTDRFTITPEAGSRLSVIVTPNETTLRPVVDLLNKSGVVVASFTASAPGGTAFISSFQVSAAEQYTIRVGGAGGTTGRYQVRAVVGAAIESESVVGGSNDVIPTAEPLVSVFAPIPGGAESATIIGRADAQGLLSDEAEGNDSVAAANDASRNFAPLVNSNIYQLGLTGELAAPGDADWFALGALQPGDVLTIGVSGSASGGGTLPDSTLELWRSGSTAPVAVDDDGGVGFESLIAGINIPTTDTYFVRVGSFADVFTGTYRLGIRLDNSGGAPTTNGNTTKESEPNDSMTAATNASTSWRQTAARSRTTGAIATIGDRDVFRYEFKAGDRLSVQVPGTAGLAPAIALLDSNGSVVAFSDGTTVAGTNSGLFGFIVPTNGTYYLDIRGGGIGIGSYTADVFLASPAPPALGKAAPDLFAIDLGKGQVVSAGIGRAGTGGSVGGATLDLLDSLGKLVAAGTGGATNFAGGLSGFTAPSAGLYYIRVADTSPADYVLTIVRGGALDREPNDSGGSAQPLGAAPVVVGAIEGGNNDWYIVTVPAAGGVITLETATPGDGPGQPDNKLDAKIEVFAPDNTPLASDDNSAPDKRNASLRVAGSQAGAYRVRVSSVGGTSGEYVLTARVGPNQSPTAVSAGGPYTLAEGDSLVLSASANDPDGDTLLFSWDLNGDGQFGDTFGAKPTLSWAELNALGITSGPAVFNVQVRASDGFSTPAPSGPTTLTVTNVDPTATFKADAAVLEGQTATVRFSNVTDPSPAATGAGLRFSFDFDNDGVFDFGTGTYAGSVTAAAAVVPVSVLGDGPSTRPVRGRVIDFKGGFTDYIAQVTVNNANPTAELTDNGPVNVGTPTTLTFVGATDPSAEDVAAGLLFSFDFNNDGDFTDPGDVAGSATPSASFVFPSPGTFKVLGRVSDRDGGFTDIVRTVTVLTVPPTATFAADAAQVPEGGATAVRFTGATHPSQAAIDAGFRYAYDFDNDGVFNVGDGTYSGSVAETTADLPADVLENGPVSRVIRGRVIEVNGGFTDYTVTIDVENVAPTAKFSAGPAAPLGTPIVVRFTGMTDPSPTDVQAGLLFSFDFDNDGDFTSPGDIAGAAAPTASFAFRDPGQYTVRGRVADRDGGFTDYTTVVTVANVPPTAEFSVFAPSGTAVATEGEPVTLRILNAAHPSPVVQGAGLKFAYDFDNDGTFDVGDGTYAGSVSVVTAAMPQALLDGPATLTVRARVVEVGGLFTDYTTTLEVLNAAPTATLVGPTGPVPATVPLTITLDNATDGSPPDVAAGLRFSFDFNNDGDFTDPGDVADSTSPSASFAYTAPGFYTLRARVADRDGAFTDYTLPVQIDVPPGAPNPVPGERWTSVGAGPGGPPQYRLFDPAGTERIFGMAFETTFTGGVRVATGDVTGDGVPDVVVGTGPGRATEVRVLDGRDGRTVFSIQPFEASFTGGVYVSVGDVDGDGRADIAITPDEGGGPRVRVLSGDGFGTIADFFGIRDADFRGGARSAFGDVNNDGTPDLVVAAGFGGGPRVSVWDGKTVAAGNPQTLFNDFFVFEQSLRNGVFIAAGDLDGDGFAEVIAGGGPGGGPRVFALSGKDLLENRQVQRANFFAGDPNSRGGVRVTAADFGDDNLSDIVTGAGDGDGSRVVGYRGADVASDGPPPAARDLDAFSGFSGGVYVG